MERGTGDSPRRVPDRGRCADAATPGAAAADPDLVRRPVAEQGAVQARRPLGRGDAHACRVRSRRDHAAGRVAGRSAIHPPAPHGGRPLRRDIGGSYRRRGARPRRRAGSPVPGGGADLVDRGAGLVARQPAGRDEPGPSGAAGAGPSPALIPRSDYADATPGMSGPATAGAGRGALASVIMDVTCRASSSGTVTVGTSASGSSLIGAAEGVTLSSWYPGRATRGAATAR